MTQIYIKPSSNQRSTTSREASAAGRLRPNGIIAKWDSGKSLFEIVGGLKGSMQHWPAVYRLEV